MSMSVLMLNESKTARCATSGFSSSAGPSENGSGGFAVQTKTLTWPTGVTRHNS